MPLFSQLPPGVQIRRWFAIMTVLVILIDLIAAASLVVMTNYMHAITGHYEPLLISSRDISGSVYRMETSIYRYLYGLDRDTGRLQVDLRRLREEVAEVAKAAGEVSLKTDLSGISEVLTRQELAVKALPQADAGGIRKGVEELAREAANLSRMTEDLASRIGTQANEQIAESSHRYRRIALTAQYVFVAFLAISVVMIILLFLWWREFEEMILQL